MSLPTVKTVNGNGNCEQQMEKGRKEAKIAEWNTKLFLQRTKF
ncbi:MAG TPA: hypothetical protein VNR87_00400 [Flavisolibacter sp.]|nr:hypothetical protein [Flavisolibacter sp.]